MMKDRRGSLLSFLALLLSLGIMAAAQVQQPQFQQPSQPQQQQQQLPHLTSGDSGSRDDGLSDARGNISVWGVGEIMVDANVTQIQVSVEVRSQSLPLSAESSSTTSSSSSSGSSSQGQWTSGPEDVAQATPPAALVKKDPSETQLWQSADVVQRAVSQRTEQLVSYLQSQEHIQQLKTVSMSLRPLERWKDGELFNYGWIGVHTLSFEVDAEYAGQYIDGSTRHGATRIDSVSMKPSDHDTELARAKALQLATQNAMEEAALLMNFLGQPRESLRILDIEVEHTGHVIPFRSFAMDAPMSAMAENAAGGHTPVVGGQHPVTARVKFRLSFDQAPIKVQQISQQQQRQ